MKIKIVSKIKNGWSEINKELRILDKNQPTGYRIIKIKRYKTIIIKDTIYGNYVRYRENTTNLHLGYISSQYIDHPYLNLNKIMKLDNN